MSGDESQRPPLIQLDHADETQAPLDSQQLPDYENMQVALPPTLPVAQAVRPPVPCLPKIEIGQYRYLYERAEDGTRQVSQG